MGTLPGEETLGLSDLPPFSVRVSYLKKKKKKKMDLHRRNFFHNPFILETPKEVLAKNEDPDQMPHNVASDQVSTFLHIYEAVSNKNI